MKSHCGPGTADLGKSRADRVLAGDKGCATSSAALLSVVVGEHHPFVSDTVDIRRTVAHHAATKVADVPNADVISPQNKDVWFLVCHSLDLPFPVLIHSMKAVCFWPEETDAIEDGNAQPSPAQIQLASLLRTAPELLTLNIETKTLLT